MPNSSSPALTPEQWQALDYRQTARELDNWAKTRGEGASGDDSTEYVAKLGLTGDGSVIAMNRAHDRVLVPPPARAALAAFALADQPFGFTPADATAVLEAADRTQDAAAAAALRNLGERIRTLSPPGTS
jgi:hypothetical protein